MYSCVCDSRSGPSARAVQLNWVSSKSSSEGVRVSARGLTCEASGFFTQSASTAVVAGRRSCVRSDVERRGALAASRSGPVPSPLKISEPFVLPSSLPSLPTSPSSLILSHRTVPSYLPRHKHAHAQPPRLTLIPALRPRSVPTRPAFGHGSVGSAHAGTGTGKARRRTTGKGREGKFC